MASYKVDLIARLAEKPGFKSKIEANCVNCIYDDLARGTWRQQVQNCTVSSCALYSVRPCSSKRANPSPIPTPSPDPSGVTNGAKTPVLRL